jgi:hypothetical protein
MSGDLAQGESFWPKHFEGLQRVHLSNSWNKCQG